VTVQTLLIAVASVALTAGTIAQPSHSAPAAPIEAQRKLPPGALEPLAAGEGRAVATKLADELERTFVLPDAAKRYAAMLRSNAAAGRYDNGNRGDLAKLLTDDMMAVQKDGHLHVALAPPKGEAGARTGQPRNFPPLVQSAKQVAPGIAYIRFSAFMGTEEEMAAVRKFMADNVNAKTIIFDLRNHHGGGLDEMDAIFPYLFAARTPLVKLEMARAVYDERGSPIGEAPSLEYARSDTHVTATHHAIAGAATPLRDATVYLLVSNATASAGEHFSLAFKTTGRGTLIGEATAGANHFGGPMALNDNFSVWMPVGRTYDIKTGKDWEGDGIAPDIAVDPTQALVVALEKAGLSKAEAERINATEIPAEPVHRDKLRAR
jgi:hypothetical protein